MYIWNTKNLATDIKNNVVSQRDWKNYYLTMSIFITIAIYLTTLSPRENLMSVAVEAIFVIGILIFGVSYTYESNKGEHGSDYIARMTALALPVLVKLFMLSLVFGVLVGVLSQALSLSESALDWVMVVFAAVVQAIFFWRINFYIKYINA